MEFPIAPSLRGPTSSRNAEDSDEPGEHFSMRFIIDIITYIVFIEVSFICVKAACVIMLLSRIPLIPG